MKTIAILISNGGSGTNLQALIDGIESGKIHAKITVVVSDKEDAYGLVRAKRSKISTHIFDVKKENIIDLLTTTYPVDYIALTGWKKIIPDELIAKFPNRIINIHPGLIPKRINGKVLNPDKTVGLWNRGMFTEKAIANFFEQKATYAGSTVHCLSHEFDFGKVLAHCFEEILPMDTVATLYQRLKQKENEILVNVFAQICTQDEYKSVRD